jgi:CheY-like chemotaxis protein
MPQLMAAADGGPIALLLVEDNRGDVILTREAFRSAKIANELTVARDGEEALSMLRREAPYADQRRPDLILLDLNLPCMDGREVLKQIRADPQLRLIPVIVMTSSGAEIDVVKSFELKANGYVVKPIDFDRLKDIVGLIDSLSFAVVLQPSAPSLEQLGAL